MQRHAASAIAAGLLVAIGCSSSAAETSTTGPVSACPKGSLHTVYEDTHKCLGLVVRKRIHAGLAQVRDRGVTGAAAYRRTASRFRVGTAAVKTIAAEGARVVWPLPPAPKLPEGTTMLPAGGARAASALAAEPGCITAEPGRGVVHLSWRPAAEAGSEQRVIATIFVDGFERPAFEASGPLGPGRTSFDWYRVHGQAIHFWKVLTRRGDSWTPTAVSRFTGPTCPADFGP